MQLAEPELKIAVQMRPLMGLISAKVICPLATPLVPVTVAAKVPLVPG